VVLTAAEIAAVQNSLPELPLARRARFIQDYQLSAYDAEILTSERGLSDYYEESVQLCGGAAKLVSN